MSLQIWINIAKALWGSRGTYGVLQKAVNEGEKSVVNELEASANADASS